MAKIIAPQYIFPLYGLEWQTRVPIRAREWQDHISHQNLLYSQSGARLTGLTVDPGFLPQDTTFGPGNLLADMSLTDYKGLITPSRPDLTDNKYTQWSCAVYGEDVEVRFGFESLDGVVSETMDVTCGASPGWYIQKLVLPEADAYDSGGEPRTFAVTLEARRLGDEFSEIWTQASVNSAPLSSQDLE